MSNGTSEQEEFEFRLRLEREQAGQPSAPAAMPGDEPVDERTAQIQSQEGLREAVEGIARQLGLTVRAGVEGATAPANILGDVSGLRSSEAVRNFLTKLGLPVPREGTEEFANVVAGGMAGAGGLGAAARAAQPVSRAAQGVAETLAARPGVAVVSGGGAGAGGEIAEESGAGPVGQMAAGMGGALVAPGAAGAGGKLASVVSDVANALRAAFGSQKGIERIAADAVKSLTKSDPNAIASALERAPQDIPGVKPTVAEAIAERNIAVPEEQVGGAVVKMQQALTGAKGVEDLLPSVAKGQEAAVKEYLQRLTDVTNPMRSEALGAARSGGTQTLSILGDVARLTGKPKYQGSKIAMRAIRDIGNMVGKATDQKTGFADPEALYSIRKEIGNMIERAAGGPDPVTGKVRWDKSMSIGLETELKRSIDDAIEAAGGTGWKRYLDFFSKGRQPVTRRQQRLEKIEEIAGGTEKTSVEELAKAELPTIPTLLHRPTMAVNFALKLIGQDLKTPVTRELAKRMTDPQKFLELMRRPDGTPAKESAKTILARAAILANLIQQHQQDVTAGE